MLTPFNRARGLALSWYVHPDKQDRDNLELSGVRRLYIPLDVLASELDRKSTADSPNLLDYLQRLGCTVIARLDQHNYYGWDAQVATIAMLGKVMKRVTVERVVCGVEPDNEWLPYYAFKDSTQKIVYPNWGNQSDTQRPPTAVEYHRFQWLQFLSMYRASFRDSPPIYSPAHTSRHPNPSAPPWPGAVMWNHFMHVPYQKANGRVIHSYTDNCETPVDLERLEYGLQIECSLWGPPPFMVGELGINKGAELDRVRFYLDLCRKLLKPWMQQPGFLGSMIDTISPFTSNGNPDGKHWNATYIIRNPESYRMIRAYIDGL